MLYLRQELGAAGTKYRLLHCYAVRSLLSATL